MPKKDMIPLRRYTVQVDDNLYAIAKSIGAAVKLKAYIMVNLIFLLGLEDLANKLDKLKSVDLPIHLDIRSRKDLDSIRKVVTEEVNKKVKGKLL